MRPFSCIIGSLLCGVALAFPYESTSSICNALSSVLSGDIFLPDTDTYNASITSYPFVQLRLHPTCLLRPKTAQDVSTALGVLRESRGTKFAVRGGGHNANAGFNNVVDGVTIDMRNISAIVVKGDLISVGAGAIWQQVYDTAEKSNLTVLGGRIGVVGVAGFTTGGGISFFSPERGWACDGVANFEVVLANGTIVNANGTSHSDLFAALKGGQNNFGIVTRFDLQAFPATKMYGGRIAYAAGADTALLTGFTKFKDPDNYDPYAAGWVTNRYNSTLKTFAPTSILWYTKPQLQPGSLGYMTNVTPQVMNGMTYGYPSEFARNASQVVKNANQRTIWATTTFHISPTIVLDIHSLWKNLVPKLCDGLAPADIASELTFQSLAPPPKNGSAPNSLGFASNSTPHKDLVFLQIIFYYSDPGLDTALNNALEDFINNFNDLTKKEGLHNNYIYLNFAAWFQDPLGAYAENELATLRNVAQKYDPHGFFQKQLAGGFKVSTGGNETWHRGW